MRRKKAAIALARKILVIAWVMLRDENRARCDSSRHVAATDLSSGGGIRTPDTRIMIPQGTLLSSENHSPTLSGAAPATATCPNLKIITEAWESLDDFTISEIMKLIEFKKMQ